MRTNPPHEPTPTPAPAPRYTEMVTWRRPSLLGWLFIAVLAVPLSAVPLTPFYMGLDRYMDGNTFFVVRLIAWVGSMWILARLWRRITTKRHAICPRCGVATDPRFDICRSCGRSKTAV